MVTIRALRPTIVAALLACSLATPATADQRAWFLGANSLSEVAVTAGGRAWTPGHAMALPQHEPISPILWAGGRHILWFAQRPEGYWFVRFDTRTRSLSAFPLDFQPWAMAIDRRADQLVVLASDAVYLVDVDRLAVVGSTALPAAQPQESRSLATASGRIFVGRNTPDGSVREVVVFDSFTLARRQVFPGVWYVQASRDETRVYLQTRWPVEVQVVEPGSLQLLHSGTAHSFVHGLGHAIVSERRDPSLMSTLVNVDAYDRDSLDVLLQADIDVHSWPVSRDFVLEVQQASPQSPIVLRSHTTSYGVNQRVMHVFDPTTLAHVRTMRDAAFDALDSTLLMLAPPDPVPGVHVVVNGRTAWFTWPAVPDVGEYQIIAGTAPGRSDAGVFSTGRVPHARFDDIPFGTFYVRVRAINELGAADSVERSVYVPD
jgi:hypothetical protein